MENLLHLPCYPEEPPTVVAERPLPAFKAFDWALRCRGYSYAFDQTFHHEGPFGFNRGGFHASSNPLYSFRLYPPGGSRYAHVEQSGDLQQENDIRCSSVITIGQPLGFRQIAGIAVEERLSRCTPATTERVGLGGGCDAFERVAASSPVRPAAVTSGDRLVSAATWEDHVARAEGYWSVSCAVGHWSASLASGYAAISCATGKTSASAADGHSAASCVTGERSSSAVKGTRSISCATGDLSASEAEGGGSISVASGQVAASSVIGLHAVSVTTFLRSSSSAEGQDAVAAAFHPSSRARAGEGGIVVLAWRDPESGDGSEWQPRRLRVTVGYVGENGIKPDTWYRCDERGNLVEAEADYPFKSR